MNTKTFLGNAVLQNFTLASFRMERGKAWRDNLEASDEAPKAAKEREKALKEAKKDWKELDVQLGKKIEGFTSLSKYPWKNIDPKVVDEVRDISRGPANGDKDVGPLRFNMDELWYAMLDGKLEIKEIASLSPTLQETSPAEITRLAKDSTSRLGRLLQVVPTVVKPFFEAYLARPKGFKIDAIPLLENNVTVAYSVPVVIGAGGKQLLYDVEAPVVGGVLQAPKFARLKDGGQKVELAEVQGSFQTERMSFVADGERYDVEFQNGHVASANVDKARNGAAPSVESKSEKVRVGKTFDMGEITNEWGRYDGTKIALEKDLEKTFTEGKDGKRYDAKSVLQALNAYASSTGREKDLKRSEGTKRKGGILGFLRGKKEEVITITTDSIAQVEAGQGEDFRTWLAKYSTSAEGKKEKARFDATDLYRDQYKALKKEDPKLIENRTLLLTKMLVDTNGDGLFPVDGQVRGGNVDSLVDRSAYITKPNRERNAVVDLMIWDQEFKRGGFFGAEAIKKLNGVLALGQAGILEKDKLKITNFDSFMGADAATIQRFREAYVNGRERAAAMSGNNLAEFLQGGAVEMSEVAKDKSKENVANILKDLEVVGPEREELERALYIIEGAFYMHWRRDEFKKFVGNQLKEHRVEHSIDGVGGAGRIRIPLKGKNNLAVIVDFGGGKPQSGEGTVFGVSAGLEYSIQKGKNEYRVIAGTGVISGGWSRRTESGKEYGVNGMASYFGSLLSVVGHYNWDGLKGKLDKRVAASIENSGLNTIISGLRSGGDMKGAFTKIEAWFGENNQLHADLMAPILAQFGVESASKIPADKQEAAALMYTKMVATMVTQIQGQEASWMKDNTKFGLAGIQGGFALIAGIPAPVFGIILRHGVETFEGVKSPTSDAIRRIEEAAQRRIDKDKDLIGSEAELGKRGNVIENKASKKVDIAGTKLQETENGLKIKEEKIEGEVDLWSETSLVKEKVDEKEWDPYLDSKIGGKMNAKLSPNGFRVRGLEKGTKDRYLAIDVKGIADPLNRYGAGQKITVLADSGATVTVSPDGKHILAGGTVANISAKTRLWAGGKDTTIRISGVRGESSHAYGKDTPRIEMGWNAEEGRAANIEAKNATPWLKIDAGAPLHGLPDVRQVQEAIRVQEGMRAYETGIDGRMGELMRVEALQANTENTVRNAATLERYLAPTMQEIEKQVKDKKKGEGLLEKLCFDAFVGRDEQNAPSQQVAKDALVDRVVKESKPAKATGGAKEVALSTPINDAERTYIINRLVDAYFVDRPSEKVKDLNVKIMTRIREDKTNAVKALADDMQKVLGAAPAGVKWDDLSQKLHDITYEYDSVTGETFADRVVKVEGSGKKAKRSYSEGELAKGDMILSVTAHRSKGQKDERFGMAGFVGAEGAHMLSLTDVSQFSNVSKEEKDALRKYMTMKTNGVDDMAKLRGLDIADADRQADLLRLPIVQQLRVAFPVLLGAEKTEGLAKAMDAALRGNDVEAPKVDFTAIRDIVADLMEGKPVERKVATGVMSHSLDKKGDDHEIMATVTLSPKVGDLKVGAYKDCTNFSLVGGNGYGFQVALEGVGVDRWNVPSGPGQASSYTAIEQTALGSIVKGRYSKWSILLAKCVEETTSWSRVGFGQPRQG